MISEIEKLNNENTKLLYIVNKLEYFLNYENDKKYIDENNSLNHNSNEHFITLINIHALNENSFNFYYELFNKSYLKRLLIMENYNNFLIDIINFYKVFLNNKQLNCLENEFKKLDLNIRNNINHIENFYYQLY